MRFQPREADAPRCACSVAQAASAGAAKRIAMPRQIERRIVVVEFLRDAGRSFRQPIAERIGVRLGGVNADIWGDFAATIGSRGDEQSTPVLAAQATDAWSGAWPWPIQDPPARAPPISRRSPSDDAA